MKQEASVKLTIPQLKWLYSILSRGFDVYFENNPRERKLCDNAMDRISRVLDEVGVKYNFPFIEERIRKK